MRRCPFVFLVVVSLLVAVTGFDSSLARAESAGTARAEVESGGPSGSFALGGQAARDFRLPSDLVAVRSWTDASGHETTRYQQMVGGASVVGGQTTVTRDASGTIVAAIG